MGISLTVTVINNNDPKSGFSPQQQQKKNEKPNVQLIKCIRFIIVKNRGQFSRPLSPIGIENHLIRLLETMGASYMM